MAEVEFGHIEGFPPGSTFATREELSLARVHRPTQAGIAGIQATGADSIVLSGGYEDDVDNGTEVIYTGHGGRDPNTGRQVADQVLDRGNLALVKSMQDGRPLRVIRGSTHKSPYSPRAGYRYDGLYRIEDWWHERGAAGFNVIRFRLVKIEEVVAHPEPTDPAASPVPRAIAMISRVIRDTAEARSVKELYEYRCQVCGERLEGPAGPYAEGAHIMPIGEPHNGPDTRSNILCLCPNHHALFDLGAFTVAQDYALVGIPGKLAVHPNHHIDPAMLAYRREHYGLPSGA